MIRMVGAMRRLPVHADEYLQIARLARLTCPVGRAIAAANRRAMGWPSDGANQVEAIVVLRRFRLSTARRWLAHWMSGGHIRSLKHSQAEWNHRRNVIHHEVKKFRERLG